MLQVCRGCCKNDEDYLAVIDSLFEDNVPVVKVPCLGACSQSQTIALSAPGKYTWVIGQISPEVDGLKEGLSDFVRLYENDPLGVVPWSDRPLVVRNQTVVIAKVPPA